MDSPTSERIIFLAAQIERGNAAQKAAKTVEQARVAAEIVTSAEAEWASLPTGIEAYRDF